MSGETSISLFGVQILNVTMEYALARIDRIVREQARAVMFFVNAYSLNVAWADREFRNVLASAHSVFGDGIGVWFASKIAGTPIVDNVNGTDMLPLLCKLCIERGYSLFLLGAKPGVDERMGIALTEQYPGLRITGCHHGYFDKEHDSAAVVGLINNSNPDILLVAFGVPEQEKWIHRYAGDLHCAVAIGVGGLFDFYSGDKPRAPLWMRKHGLEWVFRLICEPRRLWHRYLVGSPLFIWRVFEGRLTQKL